MNGINGKNNFSSFNKSLWWGFCTYQGQLILKEYNENSENEIQEAKESTLIADIAVPFEAKNRQDALETLALYFMPFDREH